MSKISSNDLEVATIAIYALYSCLADLEHRVSILRGIMVQVEDQLILNTDE